MSILKFSNTCFWLNLSEIESFQVYTNLDFQNLYQCHWHYLIDFVTFVAFRFDRLTNIVVIKSKRHFHSLNPTPVTMVQLTCFENCFGHKSLNAQRLGPQLLHETF